MQNTFKSHVSCLKLTMIYLKKIKTKPAVFTQETFSKSTVYCGLNDYSYHWGILSLRGCDLQRIHLDSPTHWLALSRARKQKKTKQTTVKRQ